MNCINCHKPHNGHFTLLSGMFELCNRCNTEARQTENIVKQGVEIAYVDRKTGKIVKETFRS